MTTNGNEERPLPDGWIYTTINDVFVEIRNGVTGRQNKDGMGFPVTRIQTISNGVIDLTKVGYLENIEREKIQKYSLVNGDILFSNINSDFHLGKTALFELGETELYHGMNLLLIRLDQAVIMPRYLHYLFNYYRQNGFFISIAQHAVNQSSINQTKLKNVEIPLAPRPEQERIVAEIEKQFTRLDQAVSSLQRLQSNLARYKASVLKAACEGRLVPQNPSDEPAQQLLVRILAERRTQWEAQEWQNLIVKAQKKAAQAQRKAQGLPSRAKDLQPGEWESILEADYARYLPKGDKWKEKYKEPEKPEKLDLLKLPIGWHIASMDQLTDKITSGSRAWSKFYGKGTGTFIMAQNVRPGELNLDYRQSINPPINDPERERTRVQKDDLLVTIVGANTGDLCRVPNHLSEHFVCQSVALMRPINKVTSKYLELYLTSPKNGRAQYERYIYGAGRPHLNFEQLKITAIMLPPLAEQERIVAEVERRLSVVTATEQAITANNGRAERLRQSILQRAFTGQLVPQNPNKINQKR